MEFLNTIKYLFLRKAPSEYKPIILVTGCGSGLGWALAKILYKHPEYRVVVTAREKSIAALKRDFIESDRFMILPLDIRSSQNRAQVVEVVSHKWGGIDILVNNAGISYRAVVEHMTEQDEVEQMKVNYFGPMELIRLVLPSMRLKGRGKIINVSSVSGMLAMPTMAAYSASKHALEGASEALWYEARIMGVNVSLIQPGFIKSNSFRNVYYATGFDVDHYDGPYHDIYKNMAPFVEKMMSLSPSHPGKIAKTILKTIQRQNPPLWIPATPDALIFYYVRRLLPRKLLLPFLFFCLPNSRIWGEGHSKKRK